MLKRSQDNIIMTNSLLNSRRKKLEKITLDKKIIIKEISEIYDEKIEILDKEIEFKIENLYNKLIREEELFIVKRKGEKLIEEKK